MGLFLCKIALFSKPEKTRDFPRYFSQVPKTRVSKFCSKLETLVFIAYDYYVFDSKNNLRLSSLFHFHLISFLIIYLTAFSVLKWKN